MNNDTLNKISSLLEKQISIFEKTILNSKQYEIEGHKTICSYADFPLFPIDNETYYIIRKYEEIIRDSLETYLIRDFIVKALEIMEIKCENIIPFEQKSIENGIRKIDSLIYNKLIDFMIIHDDYCDAFIINKLNDDSFFDDIINCEVIELNKFDKRIKNVFHMDISDYNRCDYHCYDNDDFDIHHYGINIKDFFIEYFNEDFFETYSKSIKDSIKNVMDIIGYRSVPKLTSSYLYRFKQETKEDLEKIDIQELIYQPIETETDNTISNNEDDSDESKAPESISLENSTIFTNSKIQDKIKKYKLYECLLGKSSFAKSFITAEYLYQTNIDDNDMNRKNDNLKNNSKTTIDYAPIVMGYAKTVELLLSKIFEWFVESDSNVYIARKGKYKKEYEKYYKNYTSKYDEKSKYEILAKKDLRPYFNTTLTPLLNFILENDITLFSDDEKKKLSECFALYEKECRNHPFHERIVKEPDDVKKIRNNTLFILYVILGGVIFPFDDEMIREKLECVDDYYDRCYHYLATFGYGRIYLLEYRNISKLAYLTKYSNKYTVYDDNGYIVEHPLCFIEIDSEKINEEQYEHYQNIRLYGENTDNDRLIIFNRNNCPCSIKKKISNNYVDLFDDQNSNEIKMHSQEQ